MIGEIFVLYSFRLKKFISLQYFRDNFKLGLFQQKQTSLNLLKKDIKEK
jgi:uncharacterized phage-like protein YoqJ